MKYMLLVCSALCLAGCTGRIDGPAARIDRNGNITIYNDRHWDDDWEDREDRQEDRRERWEENRERERERREERRERWEDDDDD